MEIFFFLHYIIFTLFPLYIYFLYLKLDYTLYQV